jgi:uncharacterized membrane protein
MREDPSAKYGLLAAVPLAAGVIVEGVRLITNSPWDGIATWISHTASALLALTWATTAAAIHMRRRSKRWASVAFVFGIVSPLLMFAHAAVTRVAGNPEGLLYLVAAVAAGFFIKRAFSYGELRRLPGSSMASSKRLAMRGG